MVSDALFENACRPEQLKTFAEEAASSKRITPALKA